VKDKHKKKKRENEEETGHISSKTRMKKKNCDDFLLIFQMKSWCKEESFFSFQAKVKIFFFLSLLSRTEHTEKNVGMRKLLFTMNY
jgi:hypothetical protein